MFKYIFKRLLIFIPTLFAISLLTFVISLNAPGDPVDTMLNKNAGGEGQASQKLATEKAYNDIRHQLGFDLPVFYFRLQMHRVPIPYIGFLKKITAMYCSAWLFNTVTGVMLQITICKQKVLRILFMPCQKQKRMQLHLLKCVIT